MRYAEQFSLLVRQFAMNQEYFQFWKDIQVQANESLNDIPPYNTVSNIKPVSNNNKVVGYFGIVQEQATRWYFSVHDLSYFVENAYQKICDTPLAKGLFV